MTRIIYVNGAYRPYHAATVHAEDRGYQFADAVYEVCEVRAGRLIDERRHMERLQRSLGELRIAAPMSLRALGLVMRETVRRNRVRNGMVYVQVSRGAARRDFVFPDGGVAPTVVCFARERSPEDAEQAAERGIAVITLPDNRWRRVDIKTVGLLPNTLAKQAAKEAGAAEVWFLDDEGHITEGGSSNAWIVTRDGVLMTRHAEWGILRGITRSVVLDLIAREGLRFEERAFTPAEAKRAKEAFTTSATSIIMPVVMIDGMPVGNGAPGETTRKLRQLFHTQAEQSPKGALLT